MSPAIRCPGCDPRTSSAAGAGTTVAAIVSASPAIDATSFLVNSGSLWLVTGTVRYRILEKPVQPYIGAGPYWSQGSNSGFTNTDWGFVGLAGVVFGQCTSCATTAPDYDGFTIDQVVDQYLGPLGIPAFTGANVGHVSNQLSLPSGAEVELDADARTIRLLQPIVG